MGTAMLWLLNQQTFSMLLFSASIKTIWHLFQNDSFVANQWHIIIVFRRQCFPCGRRIWMNKSRITDQDIDRPTDYTTTQYSDKLTTKHVQCTDFNNKLNLAISPLPQKCNSIKECKKKQQSAGLQFFIKGEAAFGVCCPDLIWSSIWFLSCCHWFNTDQSVGESNEVSNSSQKRAVSDPANR